MKTVSLAIAFLLVFPAVAYPQATGTQPTVGLHSAEPEWLMIQNATVHVSGDRELADASILVHSGKVVAVGTAVSAPAGTRVVSGKDRHVYPGFIDANVQVTPVESPAPSTTYWNEQIRPDRNMANDSDLNAIKQDDRRKAGFTAGLLVPNSGIVQGTGAVFLFSDKPAANALLKRDVGMHLQLTTRFRFGERGAGGPTSPMGAYALARQTMYDASWYRDAWQVARTNDVVQRPEQNLSLGILQPVIEGSMPVYIGTSNEIFSLRGARFAREFGLKLVLVGNGNEYRRVSEVADLNAPIIVPLDFPEAPSISTPMEALNISLEDLMHWDHAATNPAALISAGVKIAFTADGLEAPGDFLKQIRLAVKQGLPTAAALNAMTSGAAEILGIESQLGTLEKGKYANFVVCDGPLFEDKTKIVGTCVAGKLFDYDAPPAREFGGLWEVEPDSGLPVFYLSIQVEPDLSATVYKDKPEPVSDDENQDEVENDDDKESDGDKDSDDDKEPDNGVDLKNATVQDTQLGGSFDAKEFEIDGVVLLNLNLPAIEKGQGRIVMPDGNGITITATRIGDAPEKKSSSRAGRGEKSGDDSATNDETESEKTESTDDEEEKGGQNDAAPDRGPPLFPVNYPFGDFGRTAPPEQPAAVLIRNVTVWTCGPNGVIDNGAVLVEQGIIRQVFGSGEELPAVDNVIDGQGQHLTPGIIDCHSHMATDSGVNEVGQAITAEVRIGDFIDCDDITIYRQLAGGVTAANILHGSANPIGGQNQVIKLRWGLNDEQMKFAEAPQGIKFALGENVKQSNQSEPSERYPQTRMGVEQLMRDTFSAAREYEAAHKSWKTERRGLPPRRDLELDAIVEILNHERWIHCHSYRQDEILALIRVLDEYGITIGTFQHILEGYKVADAIAKHGGMASAFADWWAYKFEVYDATPYAGSIMHNAGIVVSFNSDDGELARHLNHEAAKAVRYGGVPEEEALKFVTLNPAKQLRIDQYVGSIEAGKHADLVLWNGHPLALTSRCEQTWIDGRKYFDRSEAEQLAAEQSTQRAELIQKVLRLGSGKGQGSGRFDESLLWPRYDEYCHGHDHEHGEAHGEEHHHE